MSHMSDCPPRTPKLTAPDRSNNGNNSETSTSSSISNDDANESCSFGSSNEPPTLEVAECLDENTEPGRRIDWTPPRCQAAARRIRVDGFGFRFCLPKNAIIVTHLPSQAKPSLRSSTFFASRPP